MTEPATEPAAGHLTKTVPDGKSAEKEKHDA